MTRSDSFTPTRGEMEVGLDARLRCMMLVNDIMITDYRSALTNPRGSSELDGEEEERRKGKGKTGRGI